MTGEDRRMFVSSPIAAPGAQPAPELRRNQDHLEPRTENGVVTRHPVLLTTRGSAAIAAAGPAALQWNGNGPHHGFRTTRTGMLTEGSGTIDDQRVPAASP